MDITFSSSDGQIREEKGWVLMVRDNWQGRGYRLYWGDPNGSGCVQVEGEINGRVYRTIAEAAADARRLFPHEPAPIRVRE